MVSENQPPPTTHFVSLKVKNKWCWFYFTFPGWKLWDLCRTRPFLKTFVWFKVNLTDTWTELISASQLLHVNTFITPKWLSVTEQKAWKPSAWKRLSDKHKNCRKCSLVSRSNVVKTCYPTCRCKCKYSRMRSLSAHKLLILLFWMGSACPSLDYPLIQSHVFCPSVAFVSHSPDFLCILQI